MIRTIIVDDESKGIEILKILIKKYCPGVEVVGHAEEIQEAVELITEKWPDLILLDIEMSGGTGFDVLEKIKSKTFHVILVTAHSEYAVKAFRYSVADYLLKPIDVSELKEAIEKVKILINEEQKSALQKEEHPAKLTLRIPLQHGAVFLKMPDIIRLEADGAYTRIYISGNKKYVVSHNMKIFEEHLDMNLFMRVHRSHIINLNKIHRVLGGKKLFAEMSDSYQVEISRRAKNNFLATPIVREHVTNGNLDILT